MVTRASVVAFAVTLAACATAPPPPVHAPDAPLVFAGGDVTGLRTWSKGARLTVVSFFSAHCPCQLAHDARLRELWATYEPRGVAFLLVDSERSSSRAKDDEEARRRGYPFPLARDDRGDLARALGADFATYTVVVDASGTVRYRGGIDTDRTHLTPDGTPYLRDALDDLLAGRPPRVAESRALGCALEQW